MFSDTINVIKVAIVTLDVIIAVLLTILIMAEI